MNIRAKNECPTTGAGTLLRRYIHGPGIDGEAGPWPRWGRVSPPNRVMCDGTAGVCGGKQYYHADWQGSVVAMSAASGALLESYSYSAFGEVADASGNPFRYTGRRIDPETGLYYYRARYYAPAIGRFLQTDPVGYDAGLHLYAYVGNDPVTFHDPSGLCRIVNDEITDCDVVVKNNGRELTAKQQKQLEVVKNVFIKVGKAIQDKGTEEQIEAFDNVGTIEIDFTEDTNNTRPAAQNSEGMGSGGRDIIQIFGAFLQADQNRQIFGFTHEVFHSVDSLRQAMKLARQKEDRQYTSAIQGTPLNFVEKRVDRAAYKFVRDNGLLAPDPVTGMIPYFTELSGYWR